MNTNIIITILSSSVLTSVFFGLIYIYLEKKYPLSNSYKFKLHDKIEDSIYYLIDEYSWKILLQFITVVTQVFSLFYIYSLLKNFTFFNAKINISNPILNFILFFILRDLTKYFFHRLLHNSVLWKLHKVHHSTENLNWMSQFRVHWAESFIFNIVNCWVFIFMNVSEYNLIIVQILECQLTFIAHANIKFKYWPFQGYLNNTLTHHWHHAKQSVYSGGQNFGAILIIWDRILNTYYCPMNSTDISYGLEKSEYFPRTYSKKILYAIFPLLDYTKK